MSKDVLHLSTNWTAKEIPIPLLVQMKTPPVDLTGYVLEVRFDRDGVEITPAHANPVVWDDITKALAKVQFADGDIDVAPGVPFSRYEIEVWAAGAGSRIATMTILNEVYPHVGAAPTI